ncbi:MAG: hypothetical protein ABIE03_01830 [Patescibacteria group bacterium]
MFNFIKFYKPIHDKALEVKEKIKKADKEKMKLINRIFIIGIALMLLIGLIQIVSALLFNPDPKEEPVQPKIEQEFKSPENPKDTGIVVIENQGQGQTIPNPIDMLNPFSSFQESIVDAISEIVMQGLELFDDYVAFTPNIAKNDGQIVDARGNGIPIHVDKFYNATQSVAWLLLPLIIVITGTYVVLEGSFKGILLLKEIAKKTLLFIIGMVAMRFLFANAIDLTNALDKFMLQRLVAGSSSGTLSESLFTALGLQIVDQKLQFTIQGTLNIFAEIILWIGLFFLLVTLLFQFIIRFFHLLLHMILFPIVFVIGLLPGGGQFFRSYLEETLRTLFMQPIFLIGIGIAIEIIASVDEPVPKVILGLGSLAFLNIIPAIINRFSGILWGIGGSVAGGIVAGATIGQARRVKEGIVSGMSEGKSASVRSWAGKALGEAIVSKLPLGGTAKKALDTGVAFKSGSSALKAGGESFKTAVIGGVGAKKAFSMLGMKPLDNRALKDSGKSSTLYSVSPKLDQIQDLSVKDSTVLSNGFKQANYNQSFEGYPLVDQPATIHQMMDLSEISFSNPNTQQYLNEVVQTKPIEIQQGRTFDTGNDKHWDHITQWYSKNEVISGNNNPQKIQQFVSNPSNRMKVITKANQEGYFKSQGIKTVMITDQIKGQKPIAKYYQLKNKVHAGNRTAKTK